MLRKVSDQGYRQYEISNFCLPGFESKHNSKYWTLDPVFGFGCSAHSFDGESLRWSNERDTAKYVSLIEAGHAPIVENTVINLKSEYLFLGLRLNKGINLHTYQSKFQANLIDEYIDDFNNLIQDGLIEIDENYLKLTPKGFLYSNEVFSIFV